jgi:UTP--glucose-1-phosphate uridylyltransferase
MKKIKIKSAIFPVAGMGTRFFPATKASPKEMLPIIDKPLIQYAVEEAVNAGVENLIFITNSDKMSIKNHFDKSHKIEVELEKRNKIKELELIKNILPKNINCNYIIQPQTLGLGHAVLCAKSAVGDDPFAVILADDMILSSGIGCLSQMIARYNSLDANIIAVEKVEKSLLHNYGIIEGIRKANLKDWKVTSIIEKPDNNKAPSDLGVVGRYILNPSIFGILENTQKGTGGEIQLTDAISSLITKEEVYAYEFNGKRFDCGSKLGFLKATIQYGLSHNELSEEFKKYLESLDLN